MILIRGGEKMIKKMDFKSDYFDLIKLNDFSYAAISNNPENISNAGFVDLGDKVVVYDTFLSLEAAKDMIKAIEIYTNTRDITVAISHWHNDHFMGNCAFSKDTDIISSEATLTKIKERSADMVVGESLQDEVRDLEQQLETTTDEEEKLDIKNSLTFIRNYAHRDLKLRYPNVTIKEDMDIHGSKGELNLKVFDIAHSVGDVIGINEKDKVLFAGDLIFADDHPYIGCSDPYRLKEELENFLVKDIDYFVPGHGDVCDKEEVKNQIEYIDSMIELVKENLDTDKDLKVTDLPEKFHHYKSISFFWNINFLREFLR